MKIFSKNIDQNKSGTISLSPSNCDDVYLLSSTISKNDVISCKTTRKLSLDGGKTQTKITCNLSIAIETIDIDLKDGYMYFKGKVVKENEYVKIGVYHSLTIQLEDRFTLFKKIWTKFTLKQLEDATKVVPEICFIIFYDKDCVISQGVPGNVKNAFKQDIKSFKAINNGLKKLNNIKTFVIASFSDVRNDFHKSFQKECKMNAVLFKLTNEYKGIPNSKVVNKLFTDESFSKVFSDIQYVDGLKKLSLLFRDFKKENPVCIGRKEVMEAFDYGAVKEMFLTDELYRPRSIKARALIEKMISDLVALNGKLYVIPVEHELGEKLKEFGSIACNLRFSFKD